MKNSKRLNNEKNIESQSETTKALNDYREKMLLQNKILQKLMDQLDVQIRQIKKQ